MSCSGREFTRESSLQSMTPFGPCWGSCSANLVCVCVCVCVRVCVRACVCVKKQVHGILFKPDFKEYEKEKYYHYTNSCLLKFCFTRISLSSCAIEERERERERERSLFCVRW